MIRILGIYGKPVALREIITVMGARPDVATGLQAMLAALADAARAPLVA